MKQTELTPWALADNYLKADFIQLSEIPTFLLTMASIAPSVHNTQPWTFSVRESSVTLRLAHDRMLLVGDPTLREAWLSLGCCVQNAYIALRALDLHPNIHVEETCVTLSWDTNKDVLNIETTLLEPLVGRRSYRYKLSQKGIETDVIRDLERSWTVPGVSLRVTTSPELIQNVARASSHAIGAAMSQPRFAHEILELFHSSGTKEVSGIPAFALGYSDLQLAHKKLSARIHSVGESEREREENLLSNAAAIGLVFGKGDMPKYWLKAGRAYQALVLNATSLGLEHSTHAAIVEGPDFHKEIASTLHMPGRLLAVIRLGYGESQLDLPHTPRMSLSRLIENE